MSDVCKALDTTHVSGLQGLQSTIFKAVSGSGTVAVMMLTQYAAECAVLLYKSLLTLHSHANLLTQGVCYSTEATVRCMYLQLVSNLELESCH